MRDLLSIAENSVMAYQRQNAIPVTNVQLGKLNALASFCCPEALFQSCEKYAQINCEH